MLLRPPIDGVYRTDLRARAAYAEGAGIYRIVPRAVCLPADLGDLHRVVTWAAARRRPLIPRGAGSAMGGGNVGEGVVVDLTAMRPRRVEVHASGRRATTGAAVTLAEINAAAALEGLRLPPDPSSSRWATAGGAVSTNAAGARSVRYGSVRRWIHAVDLMMADGTVARLARGDGGDPAMGSSAAFPALRTFWNDVAPAIRAAERLVLDRFPRTRKNASGYALDAFLASGDALDLIIGAEGTLGIVTAVEWRLDRIPPHRAALRIALADLDHLPDVVGALAALEPSAVELLDRTFLDFVSHARMPEGLREMLRDIDAVLLIELEGDTASALRASVRNATDAVRPWAASVTTAVDAEEAEQLWALRHAASPLLAALPEDRRSLQVVEDGCVPISRMGEYIRAVRRAAETHRVTAVMFGHAGDGHIHVNLLPEVAQPDWKHRVGALFEEVSEAVIRLGGTPAGEHGDGRLRASVLERCYGPQIVGLFRAVKAAFDPLGILNPDIILPGPTVGPGPAGGGSSPIAQLKVGADAVPLPADIAAALRQIERTGNYNRPRLELAGQ